MHKILILGSTHHAIPLQDAEFLKETAGVEERVRCMKRRRSSIRRLAIRNPALKGPVGGRFIYKMLQATSLKVQESRVQLRLIVSNVSIGIVYKPKNDDKNDGNDHDGEQDPPLPCHVRTVRRASLRVSPPLGDQAILLHIPIRHLYILVILLHRSQLKPWRCETLETPKQHNTHTSNWDCVQGQHTNTPNLPVAYI